MLRHVWAVLMIISIHISRSRAGSDMPELVAFPPWPASIHAPARGATMASSNMLTTTELQSTLPHGERPILRKHSLSRWMLQSTLPHGERRSVRPTILLSNLLQSTLPVRERLNGLNGCTRDTSFNPRSRTGSDLFQPPALIMATMLQSTLPHGERLTACATTSMM